VRSRRGRYCRSRYRRWGRGRTWRSCGNAAGGGKRRTKPGRARTEPVAEWVLADQLPLRALALGHSPTQSMRIAEGTGLTPARSHERRSGVFQAIVEPVPLVHAGRNRGRNDVQVLELHVVRVGNEAAAASSASSSARGASTGSTGCTPSNSARRTAPGAALTGARRSPTRRRILIARSAARHGEQLNAQSQHRLHSHGVHFSKTRTVRLGSAWHSGLASAFDPGRC
jgi:hypothetical protein